MHSRAKLSDWLCHWHHRSVYITEISNITVIIIKLHAQGLQTNQLLEQETREVLYNVQGVSEIFEDVEIDVIEHFKNNIPPQQS